MGTHNPGGPTERFTRRGWLPLAGVVGNVLIVPLDPDLAYRLKEAMSLDPHAPLEVATAVHKVNRDYAAKVLG